MKDLNERAKEIIENIRYITIATSSKDGQPWNSPVYSAFDEKYTFFWVSDQNAQHSRNIKENENVFITIYDSTVPEGTGEGVYIRAKAFEIHDEKEAIYGLSYLDKRVGKNHQEAQQFLGDKPRRTYKAIPEKMWINGDSNINGNYVDIRTEVNLLER